VSERARREKRRRDGRGMRERRRTREDWTGAEKRVLWVCARASTGNGNGNGRGSGRAAGEAFPEKSPPPQVNRTRTRTRTHRCSAGNRSQACVGMGRGWGWEWGQPERTAARPRTGTELLHRTASEGMAVHGKTQPTSRAPAAPRSGSEDTELVHKRHKDAVL
jgi:hypothetical protein